MRDTHTGAAVVADQSVGGAVDVHDRRRVRRPARVELVAESGPMAANVPVLQASAYDIIPPLLMPVA